MPRCCHVDLPGSGHRTRCGAAGCPGPGRSSWAERLPGGAERRRAGRGRGGVAGASRRRCRARSGLLAELDAREVPKKKLHWGSTGDWFTHLAGVHRREGRRRVRHARAAGLGPDRDPRGAAFRQDVADPGGPICEAVDTVPPRLRAQAEPFLLEQSTDADRHRACPRRPAHRGRGRPRPGGTQAEAALDREERTAHVQRFLSLVDDGAGGVRIKGLGSAEDGAILRAALLPLTKPAPAVDPEDPTCATETDPRDHGARMWDALVQPGQHALDTDLPPESHGARPRVGVTTAVRRPQARLRKPGAHRGRPRARPRHGATPCLRRRPHPDLPRTEGQVLDVGRTRRLVTLALWTALLPRPHCAFPGCTRPPSMCHAHHIVHWADGGPTSLATW